LFRKPNEEGENLVEKFRIIFKENDLGVYHDLIIDNCKAISDEIKAALKDKNRNKERWGIY